MIAHVRLIMSLFYTKRKMLFVIMFTSGLVACSGDGADESSAVDNTGVSATNINSCIGFCAQQNTNAFLTNSATTGDVQTVLARAVHEARARHVDATIAVTDRSGNVLAVLRMNLFGGANNTPPDTVLYGNLTRRVVTIGSASEGRTVSGGLEQIAIIPDEQAAIAKALTGAYLSSEGNAFTTRTASFIVQEHFIPGEKDDKESGPLFGVQFTQLACSDLNNRFVDGVLDGVGSTAVDGTFGPKRSPLGLSADPGGIPLYKFGTPVGGVGVISDRIYGLDRNSIDIDSGIKVQDEAIALAATFGFAAPVNRRANRIALDGRSARFTDISFSGLQGDPTTALVLTFPATCDGTGNSCDVIDSNNVVVGQLVPVRGYYNPLATPSIKQGVRFTTNASGFVAATIANSGTLAANNNDIDAFVLVDDNGVNRFPPIASAIGGGLTQTEVVAVLRNVIAIANRARAQIRRPVGSQMRATASIVDANGVVLGVVQTRDGPVFGIDTALQKARTATFFSNANASTDLASAPDTQYLNINGSASTTVNINDIYIGSVASGRGIRGFLGTDTALTGTHAFTDRSGGNLARPFFPDGISGENNNGPLSKSFSAWSPFTDGLQLDLVMNKIIKHVLFAAGADNDHDGDTSFADTGDDVDRNCSSISRSALNGGVATVTTPLANGIQIFPGSVPIYKKGLLVGGVGVSGDGVDQDDMASFIGVYNASISLGGDGIGDIDAVAIGHAPVAIRADTISIPNQNTGVRYVQCPQSPFIDSNEQNVCAGK